MENKFKLFDEVELLVDLEDGTDFTSETHENFLKGAKGSIVEIIDNEVVLVEFSCREYKDPVAPVKTSKLKLVDKN